ncbi:baseplate J family protein, partial [Pseudomonas putida S11]
LDQLAANVNLSRLVVQAEDLTVVPPQAEVLEEDDALRERVQLVYEGLTTAGPRNSYILHARNASGLVADATAESPSPAVVEVTVLALEGDGTASAELLTTVAAYLNDDDVRPVADRLVVQGAQILPYRIDAKLYMASTGPESEGVLAECRARLAASDQPPPSARGLRCHVLRLMPSCISTGLAAWSWRAGRISGRPRPKRPGARGFTVERGE